VATNEQAVKVLNGLIERCKDAESGFHTAAADVKTPALAQLFESYSRQQALFATELQAIVQRLGGQPEHSGTVTGTLQRGWMNLRSLIRGADDCSMIAECLHIEDHTVKAYEEALADGLPDDDARVAIERQLAQIREAHERIRALEEVCAKS
jgi:uncharacterized protein (TIGR02284 family)